MTVAISSRPVKLADPSASPLAKIFGPRMKILSQLRGEEIRRVVAENVEYVQAYYTDAHKLYARMHELGPHSYVVHQKTWVDGEVHVSYVENAWSLFKRGLAGLYHHVPTKYLQDYLDEFAFRYSHRHEKPRLMELVLLGA